MRKPERFGTPRATLPAQPHKRMTGVEHAMELLRKHEEISSAQETLETMGYFVEINPLNPSELCVSETIQIRITGRGGYKPRQKPETICIPWDIK